jgi:DNA modification methylase
MTPVPRDPLQQNALVRADGLELARALPDGAFDLIYLDPPFGSGRTRIANRGRADRHGLHQEPAFRDPRPGSGLDPWLSLLLEETRRLLRPGGALFVHLDYRQSHRARLLLDERFGPRNFLNEIVWHYATGGVPRGAFARKHDTILFYRNGPGHTFHRLQEKKRLAHRMSRRGVEEFREGNDWYRYRFLDDVWEVPWLTQDARERTGFPTQKPVALLERILEAATDPGMRVADLCCGSGTTAIAAERVGRRWLICDCSALAVRVARKRLQAEGAEGFTVWDGVPGADS